MFISSATNVATEPALRHTAINHQTFGYLPLSCARVRFPLPISLSLQLHLFLCHISLGLELASMENGMFLTNDIQK